jgi:diguanylate cyclase (GGDEF)-like protein
MSDLFQQLQDELDKLNAAYREKLPDKIAAMEEAWAEVRREPGRTEFLTNFHLKVHSLAGSGATYGLPSLSTAARKLEMALKDLLQGEMTGFDRKKSAIQFLFDDLKYTVAGLAPDGALPLAEPKPPPVVKTLVPKRRATDRLEYPFPVDGAAPGKETDNKELNNKEVDKRSIWLIEDDETGRESAGYQLGYFGYRVTHFQSLARIPDQAFNRLPAALIFDLTDRKKQLDAPAELAQIKRINEARVPIVFISDLADLDTRLDAVRKGGRAYLIKPFKTLELIDILDNLTSPAIPDPYEILIIDDDTNVADYYSAILNSAGMRTRTVNQPAEALKVLGDQNFDLVLMDFHMPGCSGPELAAVIRQQQAYVSIPIVYLSGETDRNQQLAAMGQGADDFLTKPISPPHLKTAITNRAQRSRVLREFMVRDSLTGLLNHTETKARLNAEVARARRNNEPLAFAMVDIDHFKRVNDTFGHLAGDGVIKSISRLLRQRLRKTDTIGRYGGEEFAVILPSTDAHNAERILNEIRDKFSHIGHQGEAAEFSATFSCGIAAYPLYQDPIELNAAADQALYQAKKSGRNRVVIAGPGMPPQEN